MCVTYDLGKTGPCQLIVIIFNMMLCPFQAFCQRRSYYFLRNQSALDQGDAAEVFSDAMGNIFNPTSALLLAVGGVASEGLG